MTIMNCGKNVGAICGGDLWGCRVRAPARGAHTRHLFGEIENGEMMMNKLGQIAHQAWEKLPKRWPHLELDAFQIMPNHIHGIVIIHPTTVGAPLRTTTKNQTTDHYMKYDPYIHHRRPNR